MAYIQSHQELARHPKTKRLARTLGVTVPAAIGHLHLLWWWALDYAQNGDITDYSADDIAEACLWDADPDDLLAGLMDCGINGGAGFVERTQDGRLLIHDWYDYAGKLLAKREQNAERARTWRETHAVPNVPIIDSVRTPNAYATHSVDAPNIARVEKSIEEKNKSSADASASLSPGQALFLSKFNMKRFATNDQKSAIANIETQHGLPALAEALTWAAENNIRNIASIRTRAANIAKGSKPRGPTATIDYETDAELFRKSLESPL